MRSEKYWNVPNAGKRHVLHHSLVVLAIYIAIGSTIYLARPEDLFVLLIVVGGGIWFVHGELTRAKRMTSHPVCRLTDELITLDYDRRIVPWDRINRVIWRTKEHKTVIFYRIRPRKKYMVLSVMHERPVLIDRKWMRDEDALHEDLKSMCQERSIPFLEVEKGFGPHPRRNESQYECER